MSMTKAILWSLIFCTSFSCDKSHTEAQSVLIIVGNLHDRKDDARTDNIVFRIASNRIKEHHLRLGHQVKVETLVAAKEVQNVLRQHVAHKQLYQRVYILGHGGYDGPLFDGEQFGLKTSDEVNEGESLIRPSELKDFAELIAELTSPDGQIVIAACNSGSTGSVNAFGYPAYVDGFQELARRKVIGIDGLFQVSWAPEMLHQLESMTSGGFLRRVSAQQITPANAATSPCKRHKVYGESSYLEADGMVEGPAGRFLCRGEPNIRKRQLSNYVANVVQDLPGRSAAKDGLAVSSGDYLPGTRLRISTLDNSHSVEVIATCCGPDICLGCAVGNAIINLSKQVTTALFAGKEPTWHANRMIQVTPL